ncbi:MAG: type II toxin-antitoxin system CcdA family antitoxin [Proteobacteria bacterium]|nr:type II toxin-antitoxin system CcdA family antitoxin [Pseudomonadota bacterium]
MRHDRVSSPRRATNVSLPADLVEQARELGISVSRACETGLADEVRKVREQQWIEENWEAIQGWNAWVEEHGLPLAKYRMF